MQIQTTADYLLENLSLLTKAIPSRPTHPILACILLKFDGDMAIATGFDLLTAIRVKFPLTVENAFPVAIPSTLFLSLIGKLKGQDITITVEQDDDRLIITVQTPTGEFNLSGMSSADFPFFPTLDTEGRTLSIPMESFKSGIAFSGGSASTDETQQILCGIHFNHTENLDVVATDGHRLSIFSGENIPGVENFRLTLPSSSLNTITAIAPNDTEEMTITVGETLAIFTMGHITVTSRVMEGVYPAYGQLIPQTFTREITLDRRELIKALNLVSIVADNKNNVSKLTSIDNQVTLSVVTQDVGNGEQAITPISITGEPITIGFNIKYLLQGLSSFTCGEVTIHLNENNQPAIITPHGEPSPVYLVMPIQFRD